MSEETSPDEETPEEVRYVVVGAVRRVQQLSRTYAQLTERRPEPPAAAADRPRPKLEISSRAMGGVRKKSGKPDMSNFP